MEDFGTRGLTVEIYSNGARDRGSVAFLSSIGLRGNLGLWQEGRATEVKRKKRNWCAHCTIQSQKYGRYRLCERCGDQFCVVCDSMVLPGRIEDSRHSCGLLGDDADGELKAREEFWASAES